MGTPNPSELHILDWLRTWSQAKQDKEAITVEYRLICSGHVYNGDVSTADPDKSTACRLLLARPVQLLVVDGPPTASHRYLRELSLVLSCSLVRITEGNFTITLHPHEEIANDLAALLSLRFRRLVAVAGPVRQVVHDESLPIREWPFPSFHFGTTPHWPAQPVMATIGPDSIRLKNYGPASLPAKCGALQTFLERLPDIPMARALVLAARLYATALQEIHRRPDISYLMLTSAVEVIANDCLSDYEPSPSEQREAKKGVYERARQCKLPDEQAHCLVEAACAGMSWAGAKFRKFLIDNTLDEFWGATDDLFELEAVPTPQRGEFEKTLSSIYGGRSGFLHRGEAYPRTIEMGLGPWVPIQAMPLLARSRGALPPVPWFERLVNAAICQCADSAVAALD